MFCSNCGLKLADSARFCSRCGARLGEEVADKAPPAGSWTNMSEDAAIEREVRDLRALRRGGALSSNYARTDSERAAARTKSYVAASVIVFLLYWVFWLPGLVVNLIYYREAKEMEATAGRSLPGVGCLAVMLYLQYASIVLLLISIVVIGTLALLGPQISNVFSRVTAGFAGVD